VDFGTVLASGGLSAVVSWLIATHVATRQERGKDRHQALREIRKVVSPTLQIATEWDAGLRGHQPVRQDETEHADDYVLISRVRQSAEGRLPWWRRRLIRRRCRIVAGDAWTRLSDVMPAGAPGDEHGMSAVIRYAIKESGPPGARQRDRPGLMRSAWRGLPERPLSPAS